MADFPKISVLGDRGILIDFGNRINTETLNKVLFYKNRIENKLVEVKIEVINTYSSLLIIYELTIEDFYDEVSRVKGLLTEANIPINNNYKIFHIPVCYDTEFALDLDYISKQKKLSNSQIISLHTAPLYQIYFIGFLPGFLYLGGLDKKLQISRKETPRREVQKGSVGIGENQTGIYPKISPGGWQILGKSPVGFFEKNEVPPSLFSAGDKIKFYAVSKEEFYSIEKEIEHGNYTLKIEVHES